MVDGIKKKIDINDLRAEKGGDPEIYRRVLSGQQLSNNNDIDDSSTSNNASSSYIDEVLSLDAQRRSGLTNLEGLRSKLSTLQKTVIAPKKKANEDVSHEVEQLKQWKIDIAKLSNEVKDTEQRRDILLGKINNILGNLNIDEMETNNTVGNKVEDGDAKSIAQSPPPQDTPVTPTKVTTKEQQDSTTPTLPLLSPDKIKSIPPERILNLNVGVLGHVDTGKTSLVKTLSSVLSTASLDKSKQSRARGITLDLGFSAFLLPLPDHLRTADVSSDGGGDNYNRKCDNSTKQNANVNPNNNHNANMNMKLHQKYDLLQVTLVDCPGHASLIRTIIGGAQIIDMVLLVVDATKGMQTQTAECLVIAEMTTRNLIVVLNKIDMFPENEREERLRVAEKKMRAALRGTKFEDAQMVGISA